MQRIGLVSGLTTVGMDEDLAPLRAAIEACGATAEIVCWDDPSVSWGGFDTAVLRSTWDYHERRDEFDPWVRQVAAVTRLLNPLPLVEWNWDKGYLSELAAAGVPVVPTSFADQPSEISWPESEELVVKPSISAGSRSTARFSSNDRAAALTLAESIWAAGKTVMIQPYLADVDSEGEHALIYIGGEYSHAFLKGAILRPGDSPTEEVFAPEEIGAAAASPAQREAARAALDAVRDIVGEEPVYARVDLVPGEGEPVVLELELIEPSLYHFAGPGSAHRLAAVVLERSGLP